MPTGFFKNSRVYFLASMAYWGIILFGYDVGIAGGVVSLSYFKEQFGLNTSKARADAVSSNVVAVLQGGAFFGALLSPYFSAWLGRRYSLMFFCIIFTIGAILQTILSVQRGLAYVYAGRALAGLGVGAISAVAPAYVSECSPKDVRGRITGLFQLCAATGVCISYFTNYGVSKRWINNPSPMMWRIPFGVQIIPAGIMCIGLLFTKESPRWLASKGREQEALENLAYLRKTSTEDEDTKQEMAEIEASIIEDQAARAGLGWQEAILGKGNGIRLVIAFMSFAFQQLSGQNSVGYYAPQIFSSIGYKGQNASLLASGVYGIIKIFATAAFLLIGIERFGRRWSLFGSSVGMGVLFFIIGALLKVYPPTQGVDGAIPPASKAMAALLYIYCIVYSFGVGPVPWIYVSEIFPTRTRHYGLAFSSASHWLFNFVVAKITPMANTALGWKLFMMFATIDIGGFAVFSLLIPETKGRSLEEMDVVFGSITAEKRAADVRKAAQHIDGKVEPGVIRSEERV